MASIKFIYQQIPFTIQANQNDLFKDIAEKFAQKASVDLETVSFEGDGGTIQENDIIKDLVKQSNEISITVNKANEEGTRKILVDSKEVICPECKEPCRFQIENYQVKLSNCKNGHLIENMKLKEFSNKQKVNYANIICDSCKNANKGEAPNHQFNFCLTCNKNLCLMCGYNHDKTHKIINHDNKNYTCLKHNEFFSKYCLDCQKNICIKCEDEHASHKAESFSNILPDIKQIKNNQKDLKNLINSLAHKMKEITDELIGSLEALYKINDNLLKILENQNRNYQILKNGNEINVHNKLIIDDINSIINDNNLSNIIQIYNKMKEIKINETKKANEEQKKEQYIVPVSKNGIIKIYNNMQKYVCGILRKRKYDKKYSLEGTGFFAKIPFNSKKLHVLITDSWIGENAFEKNLEIPILLNNSEKIKNIKLDDSRKRYLNKKLNIKIIEIKKDDGIKFFYEIDSDLLRFLSEEKRNIFRLSNKYNNESIYSINFNEEKRAFVSYGIINNINEKEIKSNLYTKKLESGGPIVLLNNNNLIGINSESQIPLIEPIIEFQNIQNNLMIIKEEKSKKVSEGNTKDKIEEIVKNKLKEKK